jgi:hypothetical protein
VFLDDFHTAMLEPAKSAVPAFSLGSVVTDHLPSRSGAASRIAAARYGPETSIGAMPDTKPCVWSKSLLVGTLLSAYRPV